jgi:hypothetical protein
MHTVGSRTAKCAGLRSISSLKPRLMPCCCGALIFRTRSTDSPRRNVDMSDVVISYRVDELAGQNTPLLV